MDAQANPYLSPGQPESPVATGTTPDSVWIPRVAGGLATISVSMWLNLLTTIVYYTIRSQVPIPAHTAAVAAYFMYFATRIWRLAGLYSCRATPDRVAARVLWRYLLAMSAVDLGIHIAKLAYLIGGAPTIPSWLSDVNALLYIPYSLGFAYYLIRLAKSLGEVSSAQLARVALIATAIESTSAVVFLIFAWLETPPPVAVFSGTLSFFFFAARLSVTALFIRVISGLRKVLMTGVEPNSANGDTFADDRHPQRAAADRLLPLTRVATGLASSWVGVLVLLLAIAAPAVRSISPEFRWTRADVSAAVEWMVMIGLAFKLLGSLLCISVPEAANARMPAQIAAGSAALCLFLKTSAYFAARGVLRPLEFPVDIPATLLDSLSNVLFLIYLQRLTGYLNRRDLKRWVKPLVIAVAGLGLLNPAVAFALLALLPIWTFKYMYPAYVAIKLSFFYGGIATLIAYGHFIRLVRLAALQRQ